MKTKNVFSELKNKAKSIFNSKNEKSYLSLANEYIKQLEAYVLKILKDRDEILIDYEFEIALNKRLSDENEKYKKENQALKKENDALKLLLKELYLELRSHENYQKEINELAKEKENQLRKYITQKDQKLIQIKEKIQKENKEEKLKLCELREKVQKVLKDTNLSKIEPNSNIFNIKA